MAIFLTVLIIFGSIDLLYYRLTKITFDDHRAKINKLYCRLISPKFTITDPVIFIPGIRGSILEKGKRMLWIRLWQVLMQSDELMFREDDDIKATGVLSRIGIIPFLLEYAPYQYLIARLACLRHSYFFYYDWRNYPEANSKQFGHLVERVIKETGKQPSIIAHSMGGLLAHGYIKDHPENVDKVVYLSVPFQPGIGYFDDLNDGEVMGFNDRILNRKALFSHPASFLLLPHKGSSKLEGKELFDAKIWKENKFSVFKERRARVDMNELQQTMDKVAQYHKHLDEPKNLHNKFLFIVSQDFRTLKKIDDDGIRHYAPGDGRVLYESSFPLDHIPNKIIKAFRQTHDHQLDDSQIISQIFEFLR